jgi:hypothetical protein
MIAIKPLHSKLLLLTVFAIAISRAAHEIRVRFVPGSPSEPVPRTAPRAKGHRLEPISVEIKENHLTQGRHSYVSLDLDRRGANRTS